MVNHPHTALVDHPSDPSTFIHEPVLLHDVKELLAPVSGDRILDVTLGLGGHALVLAQAAGHTGELVGLDADEQNLAAAERHLSVTPGTRRLLHANFRQLSELDLGTFDVILADLGLSSPHVDDPSRGFTFRQEGPLDLRYDRTTGESAAQWLGRVAEPELTRVLREAGELPRPHQLARALRAAAPVTTTDVRLVADAVYGYRAARYLPQIFQALRIAVNDELTALDVLLDVAPRLLHPGGRFGVIAYHSLEDRRVKHRFRDLARPEIDERTGAPLREPPYTVLTPRPIRPSAAELTRNPRSRSARFRALRATVIS